MVWPPVRFARRFKSQLGIPVITGMARENPGVDLYREPLYIIDSGDNAARMREVLGQMAQSRDEADAQGNDRLARETKVISRAA